MNIKEIKEILQLMTDHGLTEIEVEKDGMKIKLKKGMGGKFITEEIRDFSPVVIPMPGQATEGMAGGGDAPRAVQEAANMAVVKSPMVGPFYPPPAPDHPPNMTSAK